MRDRMLGLLLLVLVVLAGCRSADERKVEAEAQAIAASGWTLAFADDFDRRALGEDWQTLGGGWSIKKGWLTGDGQILCVKEFPGNQRLEFDCRAAKAACDLTGLLKLTEGGLETGYFFGFGSEYNAFSKLMVEGREVKRYPAVIVPTKTHHVVCQVENGKLTHIVDGRTVLEYVDNRAARIAGNKRIGFYIYSSGEFRNIKVYTKP